VRERAPTSLFQRPVTVRRAGSSASHPAPAPRPGATHGFGAAHRQFVELCPFPLFQLDTAGRVLWANAPCCELLGVALRDLFGKPLADTRLGVIYPLLREDLSACVRERNAPALKRVLDFEDREGRAVLRVCWIVPERNAFGQAVRLFGYLQPIVV
jgi:PAS domain-containing protein